MKSKNLQVAAIFAAAFVFLGVSIKAVLANDAIVALCFIILGIVATIGARILEMHYEADENYAYEWYSTPVRVLAILGALGFMLSCTSCSSGDAAGEQTEPVDWCRADTVDFVLGDEYDALTYQNHEGWNIKYAVILKEGGDTLMCDFDLYKEIEDYRNFKGVKYTMHCVVEHDPCKEDTIYLLSKEEVLEVVSLKHNFKPLKVVACYETIK